MSKFYKSLNKWTVFDDDECCVYARALIYISHPSSNSWNDFNETVLVLILIFTVKAQSINLTMYSLDSLLDDINTIDKDFGTKSTEVKTIKFTPHPPTTGKGKESSQLVISKTIYFKKNLNRSLILHVLKCFLLVICKQYWPLGKSKVQVCCYIHFLIVFRV